MVNVAASRPQHVNRTGCCLWLPCRRAALRSSVPRHRSTTLSAQPLAAAAAILSRLSVRCVANDEPDGVLAGVPREPVVGSCISTAVPTHGGTRRPASTCGEHQPPAGEAGDDNHRRQVGPLGAELDVVQRVMGDPSSRHAAAPSSGSVSSRYRTTTAPHRAGSGRCASRACSCCFSGGQSASAAREPPPVAGRQQPRLPLWESSNRAAVVELEGGVDRLHQPREAEERWRMLAGLHSPYPALRHPRPLGNVPRRERRRFSGRPQFVAEPSNSAATWSLLSTTGSRTSLPQLTAGSSTDAPITDRTRCLRRPQTAEPAPVASHRTP